MTLPAPVVLGLASSALVAVILALGSAVEFLSPGSWRPGQSPFDFRPNLTLTAFALVISIALNAALIALLAWLQLRGYGLFNMIAAPPALAIVVVVLAPNLAFYAAHRSLHGNPGLWRLHRLHHSDLIVEVATTVRLHPGENIIPFAAVALTAAALGANPVAFAVYRT
jgi:sterol desaturase/sphingolipid hydroxylase (fatty acid hydroxylase superfamily)